MSGTHAVIVANGRLSWSPELVALARSADLLVAADGGANHLARVGLRPAVVVGDLDSIADDVRAWVGTDRLLPRPDQDRTDLDKTLEHVFAELGADSAVVLGALGDRPDHEIGNLGLLAAHGRGEALAFHTGSGLIRAVAGSAELAAEPGETWSFWTFDPTVLVSLAGVRWPVERQPLVPDRRPSISNRATSSRIAITAEGGPVLVARCFQT